MAVSISENDGDDDFAESHEINVTPFIDVMLVLLIIFMVAAPLATVDVPVDLPVSTAERQPKPDTPLYLTLKEDLSFTLKDTPVSREALAKALDEATAAKHGLEQRLFAHRRSGSCRRFCRARRNGSPVQRSH